VVRARTGKGFGSGSTSGQLHEPPTCGRLFVSLRRRNLQPPEIGTGTRENGQTLDVALMNFNLPPVSKLEPKLTAVGVLSILGHAGRRATIKPLASSADDARSRRHAGTCSHNGNTPAWRAFYLYEGFRTICSAGLRLSH